MTSTIEHESLDEIIAAVNEISTFLAHEQIRDATDLDECLVPDSNGGTQVDVITFCASAVLHTADMVFASVNEVNRKREAQRQQNSSSLSHYRIILVLCGGIGHSTHYMHEAVARHPRYHVIADKVRGQPEARVLQAIAEEFFGLVAYDQAADEAQKSHPTDAIETVLTVLVEDQSTNCGANASMTKALLDRHGIHNPRSIIVAQDPTMCRRTAASFEKLYEADPDSRPQILCWPTFVPRLTLAEAKTVAGSGPLGRLTFQTTPMSGPDLDDLWEMPRFADLIMGEIPRLRDTADGYGPRGKGFISHVDVPPSIENAWRRLRSSLGSLERAN
ncbi:hypothetical protein BJ166DRAFT_293196 [Pestalotiopsis sp. NC0098]|nr:hypothetical protein BJ166DRAFT_293196 [Pestalotiopsis sp. NC0098]